MFIAVFTRARQWPFLLSQVHAVHFFPSYFSGMHFNIIPHLRLRLSNGSLFQFFSCEFLYKLLFYPMRTTRYAHFILRDFIGNNPGHKWV
jgi:hypothetical protein